MRTHLPWSPTDPPIGRAWLRVLPLLLLLLAPLAGCDNNNRVAGEGDESPERFAQTPAQPATHPTEPTSDGAQPQADPSSLPAGAAQRNSDPARFVARETLNYGISRTPTAHQAPDSAGIRRLAGAPGVVMERRMAMPPPPPPVPNRERYEETDANPVHVTREDPVSTFSIDVDTAAYANVRRLLKQGSLPPSDAVRVEEMINYFDYAYPGPESRETPFLANLAVFPSPWNPGTQLLRVGIKGFEITREGRPASNLVFLLDVSGSMRGNMALLKQAMTMLVKQMEARDHIAIVVYAGAAGQVLPPTAGDEQATILEALNRLQAGGSTAGGAGLALAYDLAQANFDPEAVNRVILATDGDFNVGVSSDQGLEDFIAKRRESGVFLSVLGFGQGNYNDAMLQKVAQAGNGTANYIDSLMEARKVLVDEMSGALFPIAQDVKIQVEFNPERVAEYRLIGYETRMLRREDFNNDAVDAGEIGSGHTVTALYEITPVGSEAVLNDPLRYGSDPAPASEHGDEYAFVRIRHKTPGGQESRLIEQPVTEAHAVDALAETDAEARFAAAVAAFAQLLRGDPYLGSFGYDDVLALAQDARGPDPFGYRAEFVQLVRLADSLRVSAPHPVVGDGPEVSAQ